MSLIKFTGYKTVDTQAGYTKYKDKYYFNPVVVRFQRKQAELTKRQYNILHLTKHDKTDEEEYFNTYFMERGEEDLDYVIFSGNKSVYLVYLETQFIIDVVTEQIKGNKINELNKIYKL